MYAKSDPDMAPENFLESSKRAKEGDVYSFGVILLELSMRICLVEHLPDVSRAVFLHSRKVIPLLVPFIPPLKRPILMSERRLACPHCRGRRSWWRTAVCCA